VKKYQRSCRSECGEAASPLAEEMKASRRKYSSNIFLLEEKEGTALFHIKPELKFLSCHYVKT
jgi:hypothetical protein